MEDSRVNVPRIRDKFRGCLFCNVCCSRNKTIHSHHLVRRRD